MPPTAPIRGGQGRRPGNSSVGHRSRRCQSRSAACPASRRAEEARSPVRRHRREAIAKVAEADGVDKTDDFKKRLEFLRERELHNAYFRKYVVNTVTDDEIKARYDAEIKKIPPQEEIHARHILVKTEDEAKAIIKDLDAGKDFAELAKAKSSDPNKSEGGDLGYFGKGRMVKEFEDAAFALKKGEYTKTRSKLSSATMSSRSKTRYRTAAGA